MLNTRLSSAKRSQQSSRKRLSSSKQQIKSQDKTPVQEEQKPEQQPKKSLKMFLERKKKELDENKTQLGDLQEKYDKMLLEHSKNKQSFSETGPLIPNSSRTTRVKETDTDQQRFKKLIIEKLGDNFLELRDNFDDYAGQQGKLSLTAYRRILEECGMLSAANNIDYAKADIWFHKSNKIDFWRWVEILILFAQDKFPWEPLPISALEQYLVHVFFQQIGSNSFKFEEWFEELQDPYIQALLKSSKSKIQNIFDKIKSRETTTSNLVTRNSLFQFCKEIKLLPQVCSKYEISKMFNASQKQSRDLSQNTLSFSQFITCLCFIAMFGFSKSIYPDKYPTSYDKIEALIKWILTFYK